MKFAAYAMPSYQPEFGMTQSDFMRATLEQLVAAEGLGFDSIWVNELFAREVIPRRQGSLVAS